MKRILIDVNSAVPYFVNGFCSGVGRTTIELVRTLDGMRDSLPFEIMLYSQNLKGIGGKEMATGFSRRHLWLRNTPTGRRWASRLHLRELLTGYDLIHVPHNFDFLACPERSILTIHDAMFFSYPESFGIDHYRTLLPPLARKTRAIITISECSKRDIMQYMDVPEERIHVIPWGVDRTILHPHSVGSNRWCGSEPYFLAVSCSGGRKNTITTIRAYADLYRQAPRHHLIIVWANPTPEAIAIVRDNGLENKVHFTSGLSNTELGDLYAGATATFFPSLYEGFGLPILESMACGVPCVTCRNSSLEEVGGDAAIYVDPHDPADMTRVMTSFENGSYDMAALRQLSLDRAASFTWEACAKATVEVYTKAL